IGGIFRPVFARSDFHRSGNRRIVKQAKLDTVSASCLIKVANLSVVKQQCSSCQYAPDVLHGKYPRRAAYVRYDAIRDDARLCLWGHCVVNQGSLKRSRGVTMGSFEGYVKSRRFSLVSNYESNRLRFSNFEAINYDLLYNELRESGKLSVLAVFRPILLRANSHDGGR